jgi:hypothetical protein
MTAMPDPLEPGHIPGQNPNTPQRLPGHTRRRYRLGGTGPFRWVAAFAALIIIGYALMLSGIVALP